MVPPDKAAQNAPDGAHRKRLLLIKFGAIGDVVMAIPAAAAMHAEGFAIDWVASKTVAPLLSMYPWIQVLPVEEAKLLRGTTATRLRGIVRLWRALRRRVAEHGPYEIVATLYYDRRYRLLSSAVRARRRISLSRSGRGTHLLPGRHHTDEYARILSGRPDQERSVQLGPVPVPGLPPPPRALQSGRPRVVLVPGGARNVLREDALRRWPIGNYVALAAGLLERGCEVVLAGGPDDRWAAPHFAATAASASPDAFGDLIGALSLVDTLALFESASVTVTHDTGPLHLAGLTSTAIVTVFGPTDPHGRLPRRPNAVALWGGEGFACRPCYDGRDYAPCPHNGCMAQITPAMVLDEVLRMLGAHAAGQTLPPRVLTPEPTGFVQLTAAVQP